MSVFEDTPRAQCPACKGTGLDRYGVCRLCGGDGSVQAFQMSMACRKCNQTDAYIRKSGPQNSARCAFCYGYVYSPSKAETGEEVRHIKSRADLKFGQRERIIESCNGFCLMCGRSAPAVLLQVAHIVSVADCKSLGLTEELYNDDSNLFAACEECNHGLGAKSLAPPMMCRILAAKLQRAKNGWLP